MSAEKDARTRSPEHLAAMGQVLGELVHDLANELAVLQGWAQLARGEVDAGRLPATELQRVLQVSGTLGEMLRDVLGTLGGQGLSPEVGFDPRTLSEETIARRVEGLAPVTVRLEADLPPGTMVAGRASFWTRALANLVNNAARHARTLVRVELRLAGRRGEERVVLRVEDDGPGVRPEEREAIFRPLWRGEGGEVGLGLSAVVWAAGQLGGEVRYRDDSLLGGAAFEVRVPVAGPLVGPAPENGGVEARPEALAPLRGMRLLVVDDDAAIRRALGRLLVRSGAEVRELDPCGEPEEELVASLLCILPEIILLDLRLGGRGGLSLWRRMRGEVPYLAQRVVFVSGAAPGEADWEAAERSGQPLLSKPFDLRQLVAAVERIRAGA